MRMTPGLSGVALEVTIGIVDRFRQTIATIGAHFLSFRVLVYVCSDPLFAWIRAFVY